MDEEERQKKLLAGKERLAAFQKKKARKKKKKVHGEDSETGDTISEGDVSVGSSISFEESHDLSSSDEMPALERDALYQTDKLHRAVERITELEETLHGKQAALDGLIGENDKLKGRITHLEQNIPSDSAQYKATIDEYNRKIQDFQLALAQRDELIGQLSSRMKTEAVSHEQHSAQTQQLSQQVQALQAQLQQAGEVLKAQTGQHATSAGTLQQARDEILSLKKIIGEKDIALTQLALRNSERAEELDSLRDEHSQLKMKDKQSNEVVRKLMTDVESYQKQGSPKKSGDLDIDQQMAALRAELDEMYGEQIVGMKEALMEHQKAELEKLTHGYEAEKMVLTKQVKEWENWYSNAQQQLSRLNEINEVMDKLNRENIEYKSQIEILSNQNVKFKSQTEAKNTEIESLNNEVCSYKQRVEEMNISAQLMQNDKYKELVQEKEELNAQLCKRNMDLEEMTKKLEQLTEQCPDITNYVSKYQYEELLKEKDELNSSLLQRNLDYEELSKQLKELTLDLSSKQDYNKAIEELTEKHTWEMENLKEHYEESEALKLRQLRVEIECQYDVRMKKFKETLDSEMAQKVSAAQQTHEQKFIEELHKVRTDLDQQQGQKITQLEAQNEELSEARDALLQQVSHTGLPHPLEERDSRHSTPEEQIMEYGLEEWRVQYHALLAENKCLKEQLADNLGIRSGNVESRVTYGHQENENIKSNLQEKVISLSNELDEISMQNKQIKTENDSLKVLPQREVSNEYNKLFTELQELRVILKQEQQEKEKLLNDLECVRMNNCSEEDEGGRLFSDLQVIRHDNARLEQEKADLNGKLKALKTIHTELQCKHRDLRDECEALRLKVCFVEGEKEKDSSGTDRKSLGIDDILEISSISSLSTLPSPRQLDVSASPRQLDALSPKNDDIYPEVQELKIKLDLEIQEKQTLSLKIDKMVAEKQEVCNKLEQIQKSKQLLELQYEERGKLINNLESQVKDKTDVSIEVETLRARFDEVNKEKQKAVKNLVDTQKELQLTQDQYKLEISHLELELQHLETHSTPKPKDRKQPELAEEISSLRHELSETQKRYHEENQQIKHLVDSMPKKQENGQDFAVKLSYLEKCNQELMKENEVLHRRLCEHEIIVNDLQERMNLSESVSSEVQEKFGRQLTVLKNQKDDLMHKLELQKEKDLRMSDLLGEKSLLEENLRREKDLLTQKLHEKELLEIELLRERTALERQIREQQRLEDSLHQKDRIEVELAKQKRMLEHELEEIEVRLQEREQTLSQEKQLLQEELHNKNNVISKLQISYKGKMEEQSKLKQKYEQEVSGVKSESENKALKKIQLMRLDVEKEHADAIERLRHELSLEFDSRENDIQQRHSKQLDALKAQYEREVESLKQELDQTRQQQLGAVKQIHEKAREKELTDIQHEHSQDIDKVRGEMDIAHQQLFDSMKEQLEQTHKEYIEHLHAEHQADLMLQLDALKLTMNQVQSSQLSLVKAQVENDKQLALAKQKEQIEKQQKDLINKMEVETQQQLTNVHKQHEDMLQQLLAEHEKTIQTLKAETDQKLSKIKSTEDQQVESLIKDRDMVVQQAEESRQTLEQLYTSDVEEMKRTLVAEYEQQLQQAELKNTQLKEDMEKQIQLRIDDVKKDLEKEHEDKLEDLIAELEKQHLSTLDEVKQKLDKQHSAELEELRTYFEKRVQDEENNFATEISQLKSRYEEKLANLRSPELKRERKDSEDSDSSLQMARERDYFKRSTMLTALSDIESSPSPSPPKESDINEQYVQDLELQLENYKSQIQELETQHHVELDAIKSQFEFKAELDIKNVKTELEDKNFKKTSDLKLAHQEEIEVMRQKLNDQLSKELTKIRFDAAAETAKQLETETENIKEEMRQEQIHELDALRKELETMHKNETKQLKLEFEEQQRTAIKDLETAHQKQLSQAKDEFEANIKEKIREYETQLKQLQCVSEEEKDAIGHKYQQELENVQQQLASSQATLTALKQGLESGESPHIADLRESLRQQYQSELAVTKSTMQEEFDELTRTMQEQTTQQLHVEQEKFVSEREKMMGDFLDNQKKEIDCLQSEHDSKIDQIQSTYQNTLDEKEVEYNKALENLKVEHQSQLDTMNTEKQEWLDTLENQYKSQIETMQKQHESAIQAMQNDHDAELDALKENFETEKELLRKEYENISSSSIKEKTDTLQSSIDSEKEQNAKLLASLEQLKMQHAEELEQATLTVKEELIADHMRKFEEMTKELELGYQSDMEQSEKQFQEQLNSVQERLSKREAELTEVTNTTAEQREELEKGQNDIELLKQKLADVEACHAEEKQQMEVQFTQKINTRSAELTSARDDAIHAVAMDTDQTKADLEQAHREEIIQLSEKLQQQYQQNVDLVEKQHTEEMEKVASDKKTEVETLKDQFEQMMMQQVSELKTELEQRNQDEMNKLKEHFLTDKSKLEQELADKQQQHQLAIETLQSHHEQELEQQLAKERKEKEILETRVKEQQEKQELVHHRREREDGEGQNLLSMLRSDLNRVNTERDTTQRSNDHLLQLLSGSVQMCVTVEEQINKHLTAMLRNADQRPDHEQGAIGGGHEDDDTMNTSVASVLSDEGLDLSVRISESMFAGPDLEPEGEQIITEARTRVQASIDKLLDMISTSTQQLQEAQKTQQQLVETLTLRNQEMEEMKTNLEDKLKTESQSREYLALELNKAEGLIEGFESERQQFQSTIQKLENQREELVIKLESSQSGLPDLQQLETSSAKLQEQNDDLKKQYGKDVQELESRIHELESAIEELHRQNEEFIDEKETETNELQNQVEVLDKQLKSNKKFLEEQLQEREQEREEFQQEVSRLESSSQNQSRQDAADGDLRQQLDSVQAELLDTSQAHSKHAETLQQQLTDKQDTISDLEATNKAQQQEMQQLTQEYEGLREQYSELEAELSEQQKMNEELLEKLESQNINILQDELSDLRNQLEVKINTEQASKELYNDLKQELDKQTLYSEELTHEKDALHKQVREQLLQISGLKTEMEAIKHRGPGGDAGNSAEGLFQQLEEEREALSKKEMEATDLVEQLEMFREQNLEKDEQIQQLTVQLEIGEKEKDYNLSEAQKKIHELLEENEKLKVQVDSTPMPVLAQSLLDEKNEEIEHLNGQLASLTQASSQESTDGKQVELAQLKQQLSKMESDVNVLNQQVDEKQTVIDTLHAEVEHLTEYQGKFQEDFDVVQNMLEEKQVEVENQTRELEENRSAVEALADLQSKYEEDMRRLGKTVQEKQNIIDEKEEELYVINEQLEEQEIKRKEQVKLVESLQQELATARQTQVASETPTESMEVISKLKEEVQLVITEKDLLQEALTVSKQSGQEQSNRLRDEVETLKEQVASVEQTRQEEADQLKEKIQSLQEHLAQAKQEKPVENVDELKNEVLRLTADTEYKQEQIEELEERLTSQAAGLAAENSQHGEIAVSDELRNRLVQQQREFENQLQTLQNELAEAESQIRSYKNERPQSSSLDRVLEEVRSELTEEHQQHIRDIQENHEKELTLRLEQVDIRHSQGMAKLKEQYEKELADSIEQAKKTLEKNHLCQMTRIKQLHEQEIALIKSGVSANVVGQQLQAEINRVLDVLPRITGMNTNTGEVPQRQEGVGHASSDEESTRTGATYDVPAQNLSSSSLDEMIPPHLRALLNRLHSEAVQIHTLSQHSWRRSSLPADANIETLRLAWENEKQTLLEAIQSLKDLLAHSSGTDQKSSNDSTADWRSELIQAVGLIFKKEREALLAELRTYVVTHGDQAFSDIQKLEHRIKEQESRQRSALDEIFSVDRQSLLSETRDLKTQLRDAKQKHQNEQTRLSEQLRATEDEYRRIERQLKRQVSLVEYKVQQEKIINEDLRACLSSENIRVTEISGHLTREKDEVEQLRADLSTSHAQLIKVRNTLEQEQEELANVSAALEEERFKNSQVLQANVDLKDSLQQLQDELSSEKERGLHVREREGFTSERLRLEYKSEKEKREQTESRLEKQKMTVATLRRQMEAEQVLAENTESKFKNKVAEFSTQLDMEKARCIEIQSALEREQALCSQLRDTIENERDTTQRLTSRERLTLSELQTMLDLEKSRVLELQTALDREKYKVSSLSTVLDKEKAENIEDMEREKAVIRQLKKNIESLQNQKQELVRQFEFEKERANVAHGDKERMQSSLNSERDLNRTRELQRDTERQQERQKLREKERECEADKNRTRHTELELQLLRRKVADMEALMACSERSQIVANQRSEIEELRRSLTPEMDLQRSLEAELQRSNDRLSAASSHRLSTSATQRLDTYKKQLETIRQRLQLAAVKLQDQRGSHDADVRANATLQETMSELKHLHSALALESESESPLLGTPSIPGLNERILRHNHELTSFVTRLSEEKTQLRSTLSNLEEEIWRYRQQASHSSPKTNDKLIDMERARMTAEREAWHYEKQNLASALRASEKEIIELKSGTMAAANTGFTDKEKMQRLYGKFLRAESFRKALVYQKKYLLSLIGGFRDCEQMTLAMIAKMGVYPSQEDVQRRSRHSRPYNRFRSAVRVVIAISRLKYLVNKWRRATRVGTPALTGAYQNGASSHIPSRGGYISPRLSTFTGVDERNTSYGSTPPVRDSTPRYSPSEKYSPGNVRQYSPSPRYRTSPREARTTHSSDDDYIQRLENLQAKLGTGVQGVSPRR